VSEAGPTAEDAEQEVIEAMARSAEIYGLNRSYGRLYGILYFADGMLSLDELVERSSYAKSTVSSAMKDLQRLHFVYRRSKPGEGKRAFYEAERDIDHIARQIVDQEFEREVTTMLHALEDAEQTLDAVDDDDERTERDRQRVEDLREFYESHRRLLDLYATLPVDRLCGVVDRLADLTDDDRRQ
jgi:DNA-binding transcriptional regulator GbsR (MarR family)